MEEKKVPALRFRGFDNAWEQCKVNSLFEPLTERNDDLLPYSKTLSVATMTYKEVGNGAADSSLANYKRLRLGDVAFEGHTSKEFRYGRFVLNDAGDGIMSPRFSALRPISELPVQFWKYYIHYEPIMKRSLVNCTKAGTMMNELVVPEFLQESLLVPSTDEQVQIGKYFANLNHLIILHQRKLEMLKKIKKSMLEKMFPKNDAKVPELRFSDFTDAWEQRRLGELADKVTEKNTLLAKTEVLTNSAEFGIINQREFFDHDIVNENNIGGYYIVRERDFVYNPRISVSAPVGPINCNKLGKSGVMSPLYTVFRVHDIDSVYLEYFFKTSRWHSFMRFNGDSGVRSDRFSIKTELFYKMPIPITKYCEQVKIGKYFSQLDHLISLHQRKLEKLKNIKKSMLEKMFII